MDADVASVGIDFDVIVDMSAIVFAIVVAVMAVLVIEEGNTLALIFELHAPIGILEVLPTTVFTLVFRVSTLVVMVRARGQRLGAGNASDSGQGDNAECY